MKKLIISGLIIESTRRCNMVCDHCLRGKAEALNMERSIQETFLSQVESISTITFTGGEPSLYPQAINDFIDICEDKGINMGSFYIATNAKNASDEFISAILRLYLFCDDNEEMSSVDISNDQFHQNDPLAVKKLQAFSFARLKYTEQPRHFINQGFYADNFGDGRNETPTGFEIDDNYISENQVTLNCEGDIIAGCDWSFERQREEDVIVCHISEESYLDAFSEYNEQF